MFKRSVALIIVLTLCLSTASFAKKPVKLSDQEMKKTSGASAPQFLKSIFTSDASASFVLPIGVGDQVVAQQMCEDKYGRNTTQADECTRVETVDRWKNKAGACLKLYTGVSEGQFFLGNGACVLSSFMNNGLDQNSGKIAINCLSNNTIAALTYKDKDIPDIVVQGGAKVFPLLVTNTAQWVSGGGTGMSLTNVIRWNQVSQDLAHFNDIFGVLDAELQVVKDTKPKQDTHHNDNWNANNLKSNKPAAPQVVLTQLQTTYPGGQVTQIGNGLYYELGERPTTYQVDGKTYNIVYDQGGNPTCGYDSSSSHHDSGGSSGSSSGGSSSSSKPSSTSTVTTSKPSTTTDSSKVGTLTTAVAQSAIAKASSGNLGSLTATERAYLSNN